MKKCILLFVILIAVLTLTLVAFACQEDRAVETANASYFYPSFNSGGVVRPNLLPSLDMSLVEYSAAHSSTGYFCNNQNGFELVSNIYPAVPSSISCSLLQSSNFGSNYLDICFKPNQVGYYYMTFYVLTDSPNGISTQVDQYNGSTYSDRLQLNIGQNGTLCTFDFYVSESLDLFFLRLYSPTFLYSRHFYICCAKVEYSSTNITSQYAFRRFTGFAFPGYSLAPEPSPYDSWDGLVRQNQLNSPDFWNYPVFVESTNITDSYKNMWLSNMDGYDFDYLGPDELGGLTMNVHFYGQNEDNAFLYYYDNYADSLDLSLYSAHFRLALNSQVPGTVTLTSGGGSESARFDTGLQFVDVFLPNSKITSFIAISVVFDQYEGVQDRTCLLLYSKLEAGSLFTGYVIPDHNVSSAVQDNILNNYDFSSVPLPSSSPRQNNWWYLFDNQQGTSGEADELINFYSDFSGLTFDTSLQNANGTIYFTYNVPSVENFNSSGSYVFTVQLWSQNTYGVGVRFSAKDGPNDITYQTIFASSNGPSQYSFRFPKINGVILTLAFPVSYGQPNTLYYAKLEETSFTGFCGNFQEFYDNGYNSGYSEGYSRGSEAYGTSLFTLNFDQPDSYVSLNDFGWFNMGFDDVDSMFASTMTFDYIGFYRSLGYAIAVQKYVDVPSESIRRLYASADVNFNLSNISVAQDYVMLELSKYTSRLIIVNDQYPNDYTPEVYPNYRVVRVNVQRGLSNILDSYGGAKYEEGRLAGYDQGYMQGEADGERRGYSQATQVAMNGTGGWFGFVSAFIDVPVKTLTSMLDFDFFGFNLLNIVKIMLVFSLVYLVIRLMTKGKVAQ